MPTCGAWRVRAVERALWAVAGACLSWAAFGHLERELTERTYASRLEPSPTSRHPLPVHEASAPVSLRETRPAPAPVVAAGDLVGRLEAPRIGLEAIVLSGDDEATLRRAAGHLPDTPLPWQPGNSAVAGHRDTLFRPLRHVREGDEIRFETPHGSFRYRVRKTEVVQPDDLRVLAPAPGADLTLITCYPFDVIGAAPLRFVVQATREPPPASAPAASTDPAAASEGAGPL